MSSIQVQGELRSFQTQIEKLQVGLKEGQEEQRQANRRVSDIQRRIKELNSQIERLKEQSAEVIITDHAIVRYLQHVEGVDIDKLREEMVSGVIREQILTLKSGSFPTAKKGGKLRVKDKVVVTVIGN